jgi:hydrogenase-4 component E
MPTRLPAKISHLPFPWCCSACVTRGNAVSMVVGFMSLENGLILAATGAKGVPLVVEISVAFSVLIAFIVIGIFLFRIRERFDTVDLQALDRLRGDQFREEAR